MTDAIDSDDLYNHLQSLIFDQKHMTGRGLRFLHEKTGLDEFNLAVLIVAITSVYLMMGKDAQMLANAILTLTPILLTYVFPAEKPPTPQLLIYWSAFGLLTLLDSYFEPESGYYFIKVILLALLFLHPFNGADRILLHIRLAYSDKIKDEPAIIPFTKEELSEMLKKSMNKQSSPSDTTKLDDATSQAVQSTYSHSYDSEDKNPMLFDSEFRIQDQEMKSAESLSINYSPHDLSFEPTKYLVFNAPYDFENLTYFIRIRNTSTKHIAYAIKSNAIPRVFATPPCGILPPKQKCDIAVTVKKMDKFTEQLVQNDRLAFDYVFCPPETKQFKFKLLQTEMRRRKNIYIKYNP
ncbi:MSP (Major sperm protein) domain family protein [Acanthocheilonema viteae]